MTDLASVWLVLIFLGAAALIWVAGVQLSNSTDALDTRHGLGSALGGLILLAFATSLPELVITISAAAGGHLDLAVGNLVGGIAIQTVVLALLDAAGQGDRPLSFRAGSLVLVLEAALVMTCVVAGLMTSHLPEDIDVVGASPGTIAIVVIWIAGLLLIRRAQRGLPWKAEAPESGAHRRPPARLLGHLRRQRVPDGDLPDRSCLALRGSSPLRSSWPGAQRSRRRRAATCGWPGSASW